MLFILEGPDGSGKTALADRLRKILPSYTVFVRFNGPPGTRSEMLASARWLLHGPPGLVIVCDRFPLISEKVYGPVLRKEDRSMDESELARNLLETNTTIIYCDPGTENLRLEGRKQLEGIEENLGRLVARYDALMISLAHYGVRVWDYSHIVDPDATALLSNINSLPQPDVW